MENILFEGDILVDFLNGVDGARRALERASGEGIICVSAWTCAEVLTHGKNKKSESTRELLSSFNVVPVTWEVASDAGVRFNNDSGDKYSLGDCIVAASVCELGALLVTRGKRKYPPGDYEKRVEKY